MREEDAITAILHPDSNDSIEQRPHRLESSIRPKQTTTSFILHACLCSIGTVNMQ